MLQSAFLFLLHRNMTYGADEIMPNSAGAMESDEKLVYDQIKNSGNTGESKPGLG